MKVRQAAKAVRVAKIGLPLIKVGVARRLARHTGRTFPTDATTFWGERMRVRLPEPLSCEIAAYGYFEAGLTNFMLANVRRGMVVYDVGAHYGYFTLMASRLAGCEGEVHSFEPTPSTYRLLTRNTMELPNVKLQNVAVWHEAAQLRIRDFGAVLSMYNSLFDPRLPNGVGAGGGVERTVPAISLDEYLQTERPPDFVKIDAESAELHVLQGMQRILEEHRPVVTLEVGDLDISGVPTSRSLLEHLIDYGYQPFEFDKVIRPHKLRDRYDYDNILLVGSASV